MQAHHPLLGMRLLCLHPRKRKAMRLSELPIDDSLLASFYFVFC
jgi:hypothetical protein